MALKPCRECGQLVSTEASACPHCGVPRPTERPATGTPRSAGGDYVSRTLTGGERVLFRTRLHWITLLRGIVLGVIAAAAGIATLWVSAPVGGALLGVAAIVALVEYLRYISAEFAVTDARVLIKLGWIRRRSIEVLISKVESIVVDQGVAGRILDYGTVVITGTGGTRESFDGIAAPLALREHVQEQIVASRGRG